MRNGNAYGRMFMRAAILMIVLAAVLVFSQLYGAWPTRIRVGIGVILLIGAVALMVLLYRQMIRPILEIHRIAEMYRSADADEIRFATTDPLRMRGPVLQDVQVLIKRVDQAVGRATNLELSRRYAQLDALQQQINPHFLYNTLDTIRGQAHLAGEPLIEGMALSLSKLFRYSISNYNDLVPLAEELAVIENYMYIQNARFSDRFRIAYEIDEDCMQEKIPKMTLQPLVENAIHHGLEPKLGRGSITIYAHRTQSRIVLRVVDDGIGIAFDRLEQLNNILHNTNNPIIKKEGGHSIGLYNINSRIRLVFGEEANLTIYSEPDAGTDIRIALPLQT